MPEIERAALTRLQGVSDAPERPDPDYAESLRSATSAALEYLLAGVERGETDSLHPPPAVLVQARLAARNRVGLDIVLRRCFAGHALFGHFLIGEMGRLESVEPELPRRVLRDQAALLDRLLAAVTEEYSREATQRPASSEQRRERLVERLLAGEPLDAADLGYALDGHHLGVAGRGAGAAEALREMARVLDRRLLLLDRDGVIWTWLGGRRQVDVDDLIRRAADIVPSGVRLALGEADEGVAGWRLTHRQAVAALPVALHRQETLVRYTDVALLAAALKDDLLATSLRKMYLEPLEAERDGGRAARETLRAYFVCGRSVSSAAATLGISRQAVNTRLRAVERTLNRRLVLCSGELETALGIEGITAPELTPPSPA